MPTPHRHKLKLLVLGIDGADPYLIQRFCTEGRLPHIGRLIEQGQFCALQSTVPPTTFPAWTSFFTGAPPAWHGVPDFTIKQGYNIHFIGAHYRRLPSWMAYLQSSHLDVGMAWFPVTYPPEKLTFHISGWDSPVTAIGDSSFVHPAGLHRDMVSQFGNDHLAFDVADEFGHAGDWHHHAGQQLVRRIYRKTDMATWLLKRHSLDVAAFYFGETDTAAHHFWAFFDEASPRHPKNVNSELAAVIPRVYRAIDDAIGRFKDAVSDDTVILLASDHGSMGNGRRIIYLNRLLEAEGLLTFSSAATPAIPPWVRQAATRAIPRRWRRGAFGLLNGTLASTLESRVRLGGIDWTRTHAFSEEIPYAPGIWFNQLGREPTGTVKQRDRAQLMERLLPLLSDARDPDGTRLFSMVSPREALHDGPFVHMFPDIVLSFASTNGYRAVGGNSQGTSGPRVDTLSVAQCIGRKGAFMPGGHRETGVFISSMPLFDNAHKNTLHLTDLFDVICEFADVWPPKKKNPPSLSDSISQRAIPSYSQAQQRIVANRLQQLGYIDQ